MGTEGLSSPILDAWLDNGSHGMARATVILNVEPNTLLGTDIIASVREETIGYEGMKHSSQGMSSRVDRDSRWRPITCEGR